MPNTYTLTISDPTGALGGNLPLLTKDIDFVMTYLGQYITFQSSIGIEIDVKPASQNPSNTNGLLPGNPAWVSYQGHETLAAMVKGQTGIDPNGSIPDAGFTIYLGNDGTVRNYGDAVWFDPNPQLGVAPNIPVGSDDFISIATHELLHCLGFASWPAVNAPWDQHTLQQAGIWYYTSPTIQNVIGGLLPLDPNERPGQAGDHIGNTSIPYQPVTSDLMYEWGNYANNRWDIGQIDLLILRDLGWHIQNYQSLPLVDPLDQFNVTGSAGNDTLLASKFSSMISTGAGDDTISLPNGTGNGNYLIDGGSGNDTVVVPQASTAFHVAAYGSDFLLQSKDGSEGVSLLRSIEHIKFSDTTTDLNTTLVTVSASTVQNDYLGVTRTSLVIDQATSVANSINTGTLTEVDYVNNLLSQVANTAIPAVAVEASMYGLAGTSAEITLLATQFLPPQVANATSHGFNPQVFASEALGLAFAFGNETGSSSFANAFGPTNSIMPNSSPGDAAFATAASSAIFGAASTPNLTDAIQSFVANWKAFYAGNGLPGIANPSSTQVDLAARAAAWGDAVGVELANNIGLLKAQTANFLMDAAENIVAYSSSLVGQPAHHLFQGEV